jgi:hypothetical protein
MDMLVDFSSIEQPNIGCPAKPKEDPIRTYLKLYDKTTIIHYKSLRINHEDPIIYEQIPDNVAFKFPYMWDPYTGNRLDMDPFGPLYFHPMNLLQYFYDARLRKLWISAEDGYDGYYGDGVGQGENFEIICRGNYPERYLFRLPIQDCYLKKSHNHSIITMGPKLTDREICCLDRLIVKHWSHHKLYDKIYKKIGSLFKLKCYYDVAIAKTPLSMDLSGIELGKREDIMKHENPNMQLNRIAIEAMKNMI